MAFAPVRPTRLTDPTVATRQPTRQPTRHRPTGKRRHHRLPAYRRRLGSHQPVTHGHLVAREPARTDLQPILVPFGLATARSTPATPHFLTASSQRPQGKSDDASSHSNSYWRRVASGGVVWRLMKTVIRSHGLWRRVRLASARRDFGAVVVMGCLLKTARAAHLRWAGSVD